MAQFLYLPPGAAVPLKLDAGRFATGYLVISFNDIAQPIPCPFPCALVPSAYSSASSLGMGNKGVA